MEINELVILAHENARNKGWHDKEVSALETHALIISEIGEAIEEVRKGKKMPIYHSFKEMETVGKPEGEAIELVDAILRIADYFGKKKWDLEAALKLKMEYNKTRPYRHGGKEF